MKSNGAVTGTNGGGLCDGIQNVEKKGSYKDLCILYYFNLMRKAEDKGDNNGYVKQFRKKFMQQILQKYLKKDDTISTLPSGGEGGSISDDQLLKRLINEWLGNSREVIVFFGTPGTGKSEVLNLIQEAKSESFCKVDFFEPDSVSNGESKARDLMLHFRKYKNIRDLYYEIHKKEVDPVECGKVESETLEKILLPGDYEFYGIDNLDKLFRFWICRKGGISELIEDDKIDSININEANDFRRKCYEILIKAINNRERKVKKIFIMSETHLREFSGFSGPRYRYESLNKIWRSAHLDVDEMLAIFGDIYNKGQILCPQNCLIKNCTDEKNSSSSPEYLKNDPLHFRLYSFMWLQNEGQCPCEFDESKVKNKIRGERVDIEEENVRADDTSQESSFDKLHSFFERSVYFFLKVDSQGTNTKLIHNGQQKGYIEEELGELINIIINFYKYNIDEGSKINFDIALPWIYLHTLLKETDPWKNIITYFNGNAEGIKSYLQDCGLLIKYDPDKNGYVVLDSKVRYMYEWFKINPIALYVNSSYSVFSKK